MDYALIVIIELLRAVAGLALIAAGLAIIFGMMRVINIAHGEFLMLGGYTVVLTTKLGVNLWVAMLVLAPLVVGVFGVIVERCIVQFLYNRLLDSILATWGLSLLIVGFVTVVFGNTVEGVTTPLGGFEIGDYKIASYTLVLIAAAALIMLAIYLGLKHTRFGLIARSTMQNPNMAEALGVNSRIVYMATFGIGAALAGLAGGLLAPIAGVVPSMGVYYIGQAFITVVTGGAAIVAGTVSASTMLGALSQSVTFISGPVFGDAALLLVALVLLRLLPQGITGRLFTRSI